MSRPDRGELHELILRQLDGGVVKSTQEIAVALGYSPPDDRIVWRRLDAMATQGVVKRHRVPGSAAAYWSAVRSVPAGVQPVDLDAPPTSLDPAARPVPPEAVAASWGAAEWSDWLAGASAPTASPVAGPDGSQLLAEAREHGVRVLALGELAELVRYLSLVTVLRAVGASVEVASDPTRGVEQITLRLELKR